MQNSIKSWYSACFMLPFCILNASSNLFLHPQRAIVEKNTNKPDKLRMEDILIPNAALRVFTITMDETTKQLIQETQKKQEDILKLKEVNEDQLRLVVKL